MSDPAFSVEHLVEQPQFKDQASFFPQDGPGAIFDVGANIGDTVLTYRRLFPEADIHAFEPTPQNFQELRKNAESARATLNQVAVSEHSGTTTLHVCPHDGSVNSILDNADSRYSLHKVSQAVEVATVSLDDYCRERGISRIRILKTDTQGWDLNCLKGAADLLSRQAIDLIYCEVLYYPIYSQAPFLKDIWAYLEQFGYTLFGLYDFHRGEDGQVTWGDALFLSPAMSRPASPRARAAERSRPAAAGLPAGFCLNAQELEGDNWYHVENHPLLGPLKWSGPDEDSSLRLRIDFPGNALVAVHVVNTTRQNLEGMTVQVNGQDHPFQVQGLGESRQYLLVVMLERRALQQSSVVTLGFRHPVSGVGRPMRQRRLGFQISSLFVSPA